MKQKDADKHKPSTSHCSNKGRRKLEFEKKSKQLPLSGKIIYLDVRDVRQAKTIEGKLKQLGGTVEKFLIKDVNYVISSNAPSGGQKKVDKGQGRADSPANQSTPSPFNMGQSPSPGAMENKKETVTRGKAILQIAKHKSSHTNVIDAAEKMGIKIVALDAAIKWIEKEMLKIKPTTLVPSSKQAPKKKSGLKVQKLKTPYVKFEAANCHYRPQMVQLDTWPHVNVETLAGTCPFDGRALGKPQNSERGDREEGAGGGNILSPGTPQAQRDELSGTPQAKSQSKTTKMEENSTCKLFGVPIVTTGEIKRERDKRKREAKRKGYCECCKEKYDDVDKHLRGEQHKTFVRNKKNFDALDRLINQGPNTVVFLQSILFKHCVQKAASRPNSQQNCEDDVVLIEKSSKLSPPDLPPEQLRVEHKLDRRHKSERKHDQSRKLVIRLERAVLNENHDRGRRLEKCLQSKAEENSLGYSSPSKLRSSSFPHVDKDGSNSTAAVVIRRSGSRGSYGSPRRSQSTSIRSEKTLVIRDSPIASLQPLRDFLSKHSTQTEIDDKSRSSSSNKLDPEFRKRKSDPSCSQSSSKKKCHGKSNEVQAEVTVHSPSKPALGANSNICLNFKKQKTKHEKTKTSPVSESQTHKNHQNVKHSEDTGNEHSKLSPNKRFCHDKEISSPRKSLRLTSQFVENKASSNDQATHSSEVKAVHKSEEKVSAKGSRVNQNEDTKSQSANRGEKGKSVHNKHSEKNPTCADRKAIETHAKSEHEFARCVESPRSRSRQRRHRDSETKACTHTSQSPTERTKVLKEDSDSGQSDISTRLRSPSRKVSKDKDVSVSDTDLGPSDTSTRLRSSPRKLQKVNKERDVDVMDVIPTDVAESRDKEKHVKDDKTEIVRQRKKWKKTVRSSPSKKKGKKLSKLKLDESLCSDMSVSEVSPPKLRISLEDVAFTKHMFKVSDSSSPTFKKHSKKERESEVQKDFPISPVFKRRSRQNYRDFEDNYIAITEENSEFIDSHGTGLKELLERTPKRGKSGKQSKATAEDDQAEFETPKSGYSSTPRRRTRSRQSMASELLDQTLCGDEQDGDGDFQEVPECVDSKSETLSPERSNRRSCSRSLKGELCASPVKSRSQRGKQLYEEQGHASVERYNVSDKVHCLNRHQSPSSRRSTHSRSVSPRKETTHEHTNKRQKTDVSSDTKMIIRTPRKHSTEVLRKSPRKIIKPTDSPVKSGSCSSVTSKEDSLGLSSPTKQTSKGRRKWRQCNPGNRSLTKTVKLNRSWLLLSERSMSKLLESEGDEEPFLGFNKEESNSRLPSDMTYEEVSEVDMSEDSTREWIIEEEDHDDEDLDGTLIEETSLVNQFFPSPDKASNSSWGDACDSFLKSACEKRLKGKICSTPLLLNSTKDLTPGKKTRAKRQKCIRGEPDNEINFGPIVESEVADSYTTPSKSSSKRLDKADDELPDQEIVFNFNYHSPRRSGGQRHAKKLFCQTPERKDGKPLRLLKKASDTKKTFTMCYMSKQVKSPKPKQKLNIESGSTVIIVSPKSRHK